MPMPAAGANFRQPAGRVTLGVPAHEPLYTVIPPRYQGDCAAAVRLACGGKAGAELISFTITVKELVVEAGGSPLSITTVVNTFVPGPWASVGVQVITPLVSMVAPAGGFRTE